MQQLIFSRLNHNKRKRRLSNLSNEQPDEDSKDDNVNVPSLKKQKKEQPCAIPYLSVVPECRKRVHRMTDLMQSEDVSIGDLVQLSTSFHPDRLRGVVRFIGEVHALRYTYDQIFGHHYFGIELFGAEGDTDGTIEKEYYFHAEPKHGVFVKRDKIEKTITLNWSVPRLTIDDVIHMQQFGCNGKIRYIGKLSGDDGSRPDPECIDYGIELNQPCGDNNGCINDVIYFSACRSKCGIFLNNRYLSDLLVLRKSHLLLCGFLRHACVDFIPNDILCAMSQCFSFIRIAYYKRIIATVKVRETDKKVGYEVYDVFNMDNQIIGPMIYKPVCSNHIYDTTSGIRLNSDDIFEYTQLLEEMAAAYGVDGGAFSTALKKNSLYDVSGLRFVPR
mmetsp:Transcript_44035/g.72784  ORF Transcript_44035/g.72784 Transcript_44035/m.72784 type:complete len:388 (-) Transcript_44035:102-1265(-)